jgi:CDP-glycerol glycerophosphotransferase (TagB/SpsB family)
MQHSDVVIQSRGSLALDAIAFDTPVMSLAFDGDLVRPPNDSFLLEYAFEHYKPLVEAEGTWMVGSYEVLDRAIQEYLSDPTVHSEGRRRIRDEHIVPLDGQASQRLVDYLVESARKAKEGTLPEGDWDYTGLGDVNWSSRQMCDVRDYVQK